VTNDVGNIFMLAILAASASYIAIPSLKKIVIPKANAGMFLLMAFTITFPFNITLGMPIYLSITICD